MTALQSDSQRIFFDWLYEQLGYKCMTDWYNVAQKDIVKNGGHGLLVKYYNGSCSSALQNVYPEHKWIVGNFKRKPKGEAVFPIAMHS